MSKVINKTTSFSASNRHKILQLLNGHCVYGLLLFSKFYHYLIKTRTYIRFLSGDAIS